MFVVKYNSTGTPQWAVNAGGISHDYGNGISTDAATGDVYVTGEFRSLTMSFGGTTLTKAGGGVPNDMYVVKYNSAGALLWATNALLGTGSDGGRDITTNATGDVYVTGNFGSLAITFDCTTLTNAGAGAQDMFLAKLGTCVALPIEMLFFDGKNEGDKNILKWTTASEINNDYFTIERKSESESENEWQEIGKVNGVGNSNTTNNYQFIDSQISNFKFQIFYYRLKQVDYDGRVTYSKTISVTMEQFNNLTFNIYPIPAKDILNYQFSIGQNALINISLVNVLGNVVMNEKIKTTKGNNNLKLNVSGLSQGMYFFILSNQEFQLQAKFIKQ